MNEASNFKEIPFLNNKIICVGILGVYVLPNFMSNVNAI
jgi:hypothetical protein